MSGSFCILLSTLLYDDGARQAYACLCREEQMKFRSASLPAGPGTAEGFTSGFSIAAGDC